ncbi:MAG: hypothetical protein A2857_04900 [Candidatus Levybacteria bacterium RIFCSPHIGHO2_01_FULL_36_15]|nr:MAG: hypothetical protein A2857_04900 [Candidatus Levybacteria bacterium RIFCSPHIGHO2_01_FULL_36_15]OGH38570.1 MAG: hypothetical protein A2905_03990 [Candidatus Levybacteria bacterium RIFCSPLOWO2_01_FULL_36_10]
MIVTVIKTKPVITGDKLTDILDASVNLLNNRSIVVVTSKIISICEGRIVKIGEIEKDELIEQEAQYFLPRETNPYHVSLTITRNNLSATAGIDESNGNGYYVLWPENPQKTANEIRKFFCKKFNIQSCGIIITDSKTTPFRWGVTAISLAHSGFAAVKDYIGTKDIFGRKFEYEKLNIADCLACASTVVMGEGKERTPIAVINEIPFVKFQKRNPTKKELDELKITLDDDLYSPILKSVEWKKGKNK